MHLLNGIVLGVEWQKEADTAQHDAWVQEKMKHAEEEAAAKAAAEQAALAATRRKAYLLSQERRRQCLESAAQPMLGASRTSLRSSSSGLLLPALPLVRLRAYCSILLTKLPEYATSRSDIHERKPPGGEIA